MIKKGIMKVAVTASLLAFSIGCTVVGAATISPWASKNADLFSNSVETTFTPSWLTTANDSQYGVTAGKYIKKQLV